MIPFCYKLIEDIQIEKRGDSYLIISEIPLTVLRVNEPAIRILQLCNGVRTLEEIAAEVHAVDGNVLNICEYFNRKGILKVSIKKSVLYLPHVTVIIPTKDRKDELSECLESVYEQDYPKDRLEVIVIDDGSVDETRKLMETYPCKYIRCRESRGQSYCRNLGAREAAGDILAFLDSDCVAETTWLSELAGYFQWEKVGIVGGYVDGYFQKSGLDRYEKICSPLNMGKHILIGNDNNSTFYMPACNLLVSKDVFSKIGGIRNGMKVGEDVDLCWRMRRNGHVLLYVPSGKVRHKHRNLLSSMIKRRAEYGSSEAILSKLHPDKRKTFLAPLFTIVSFLGICAAVILFSFLPLIATAGVFALESLLKLRNMRRLNLHIGMSKLMSSLVRSNLSLAYSISFYLIRYYALLFLILGSFWHTLWLLESCMFFCVTVIDYRRKRPRLLFHTFLFYFVADNLAYQLGVIIGCLREGSFYSYLPKFLRKGSVGQFS